MTTTRGFIGVIVTTVIWMCLLLWLVLPFGNAASKVGSNPLFPFVLGAFAVLPLYPLYRLARRWPRLFSGILTLAACLLLTLVVSILHYALHLESPWVQRMFDLSQILCVASSLLLVWQAARRHG
jgi:hypothetical protein